MKHGSLRTLWRSVTLLAVVGLIGLTGATPAVARPAEGAGLAAATAAASLRSNGKIAFSSNRDGNFEIYVMNPDGSAQTRLTNNPAADRLPAWSPDGTRIAFLRTSGSSSDLYVMNADGTGQTLVTNILYPLGRARWSPDGTKFIFGAILSFTSPNGDIYTINLDGTNRTQLTSGSAQDADPDWSPDGSKIAFSRDTRLAVMNADGTGVTQLASLPNAGDPRWSPDGSKLVFSAELVATAGGITTDLFGFQPGDYRAELYVNGALAGSLALRVESDAGAEMTAADLELRPFYSTDEVDQNGCPQRALSYFQPEDAIYISAETSSIPMGTEIFVRLSFQGQPLEDSDPLVADQDLETCVWVVFDRARADGFAPGRYQAEVYVNGALTQTVRFEVE